MRFRRWHRPELYGDTSRRHAASLRKQRLEYETLPIFADKIASGQHCVDEEMARRAVWEGSEDVTLTRYRDSDPSCPDPDTS